jgi:hypothetical protein
MASWLAQEKSAPVVMVELLEKATRRFQTADWRPPLLVAQQGTLRQEHSTEPVALREQTAGWRPSLLGVQVVQAQLRRALFALPA